MAEQRINWVVDKSNGMIFNKVTAYNQGKEMLGYLEYERVGQWMHWCWYQSRWISMSPGCLQEVRDKQKELLKKKKSDSA